HLHQHVPQDVGAQRNRLQRTVGPLDRAGAGPRQTEESDPLHAIRPLASLCPLAGSQPLTGMPEMSGTPARIARWTKALSNETNLAPGGLLLKCIASASSIPEVVSASAAASDDSSSTCTFLRPSNFVSAARTAPSSNPYGLRSPQPVSRSTFFAIHIGPAAKTARAAAACLGSSPVSSRRPR